MAPQDLGKLKLDLTPTLTGAGRRSSARSKAAVFPSIAAPAAPVAPVAQPSSGSATAQTANMGSNAPQVEQLMWNPDNIRDIAESVGISNLNPDTVRTVQRETEYRIGQVITEAMRFMHHSKRTVLSTQDISQALSVLDVEPLYGYNSTRPLRWGEASLGPGQPLFYVEDEEVDFEKLINAPLPKVTRDMTFTAHWLAIEGVQPSIPQNPTTAEARASDLVAKGPGASQALGSFAGNDHVSFKPLVKHVVSQELVQLFNKISAAIILEGADEETVRQREAALQCVRSETGLHNLVPYFLNYINEKVTHSITNLHISTQMMHLTNALLDNPSLFLDPYATALCPAVLSCLIGPILGSSKKDLELLAEQYSLRTLASEVLGKIARKYGPKTDRLKARLVRTCLQTWCETKSLPQAWGAFAGIDDVGGPKHIMTYIIPILKPWQKANLGSAQKLVDQGKDVDYHKVNMQLVVNAIMKALKRVALQPNNSIDWANGDIPDDAASVEEAVGGWVGREVVALNDLKLNKIIISATMKDAAQAAQHAKKKAREEREEASAAAN